MNNRILSYAVVVMVAFAVTSCKQKAADKVSSANMENAVQRDAQQAKVPVMSFESKEHDFGQIAYGAPQEKIFEFTNTGDAPLIITDAKSSCGCTVPDYPKNQPIAPGESGSLVVKFNGTGANQVTKSITLNTNTATGTEMLRIKAFIQPRQNGTFEAPFKTTN